jgi:hypothetical protein
VKRRGGKAELNPAFEAALQELGRTTTPEDLRRRGVRSVTSIGKADVARLIEISVNRTLLARTVGGLSEDERRFVIDAAEEAFSGDVRTMQDLASSRATIQRDRRDIQDELERLKRELAPGEADDGDAGGAGFEELRERDTARRLRSLRLRVQARLLPVFDRLPPGGPTLRATVLELMAVFAQEHEQALARERDSERGSMAARVEQLERRIGKLMRSLEETESVLARVAGMKNLEQGIESIYRTVQGLSPADADQERKLDMMRTIFEANLELRAATARPPVATAG